MVFTVPVASIMMFSGHQVLVQHLQPMKGLQSPGDLLDDAAHGVQLRLGIVDHPSGQRLAVDELGDGVQIVSLASGRTGPHGGLSMRRAIPSSRRNLSR